MKITNHKIDVGNHAACSIVEVRGYPNVTDTLLGVTKEGFYFFDESEAYPCGPFDSLELAIEARDDYFINLEK